MSADDEFIETWYRRCLAVRECNGTELHITPDEYHDLQTFAARKQHEQEMATGARYNEHKPPFAEYDTLFGMQVVVESP